MTISTLNKKQVLLDTFDVLKDNYAKNAGDIASIIRYFKGTDEKICYQMLNYIISTQKEYAGDVVSRIFSLYDLCNFSRDVAELFEKLEEIKTKTGIDLLHYELSPEHINIYAAEALLILLAKTNNEELFWKYQKIIMSKKNKSKHRDVIENLLLYLDSTWAQSIKEYLYSYILTVKDTETKAKYMLKFAKCLDD